MSVGVVLTTSPLQTPETSAIFSITKLVPPIPIEFIRVKVGSALTALVLLV